MVRSFQLALSRADTLDETLGIEIIVYSVALVLCKIGDVFITLLVGFFVYFSIWKLVNKADSHAARPHLSPALHDFSSVLSLAYSLTTDAGMAGERVATTVDLGSLSTAIADRLSHNSSASPPPFNSLFASSGKTSFSTDSVSNIGQVQAKTKPKRSKLQMEKHVPESKSFLTLVNGDISETLDYPDSKLATPGVDLTSRPLLPPEYTSPFSSPSTIENEEYFRVAATGISNNVGSDSIESLSVGKLASTTSMPTSSNRFRFRKVEKSILRSRASLAYIKSSLVKDRRRLDIQSSIASYGRQRPASPVLTRISASASQPSTTRCDIERDI